MEVEVIPCVQIPARLLLARADVKAWIENKDNAVPVLFCGDVFTVFDSGEGPHSPLSSPDHAMPGDVWGMIDGILAKKGINYCVVRLMNVEE